MRFSPSRQIHCGHRWQDFVLLPMLHRVLWCDPPSYHRGGRQVKSKVQSPPWKVFFDHHGLCRPRAVVCSPDRTGGPGGRCIKMRGVGHGHLQYVKWLFPQITLQGKQTEGTFMITADKVKLCVTCKRYGITITCSRYVSTNNRYLKICTTTSRKI